MTYADFENSTDGGKPYELYKFTGPIRNFYYTSRQSAVTFESNSYEPIQLERNTIDIVSDLSQVKTMDFSVPFDAEISKLYGGVNTPASLTVEVFRCHEGLDPDTQAVREWWGEAVNFNIKRLRFTIQTRSILQAQALTEIDGVYYQFGCNNRVYDARCQANPADFRTSSTVTRIDGAKITVADDGRADNELQLGTIENTRTGEVRSISGNVANLVTMVYPFVDVLVGDTVQLTLGCDNRMTTCINRFNNIEHYTGFRYIPLNNPYEGLT